MVEACQTDFMLVGNGEALDDTTVKPRTNCGLAEIAAYTVSTRAGRAENSILAIANTDYQSHLTGIYRQIQAKDPAVVALRDKVIEFALNALTQVCDIKWVGHIDRLPALPVCGALWDLYLGLSDREQYTFSRKCIQTHIDAWDRCALRNDNSARARHIKGIRRISHSVLP